ncbi:MAG: hypothetical protein IPH39_00020 [Sulfuritalea sp.]|nr:hypothetical protein [Sulfuritalea sp.]
MAAQNAVDGDPVSGLDARADPAQDVLQGILQVAPKLRTVPPSTACSGGTLSA